jgi:hypothetical protein
MSHAQQGTPQAPAAPPAPAKSSAELELQDQIRQTIRDAQAAAREAQENARTQQRAARAAQGGGERIITVGPPGTPSIIVDGRGGGGFGGPGFGGPRFNDGGIPPQVAEISIAFFVMCAVMVIGWPIARAFGRRIERRGETATVAPAMADQLQRIEQAVEAMSIEVERISESQRFIARIQNERIPQAADRA